MTDREKQYIEIELNRELVVVGMLIDQVASVSRRLKDVRETLRDLCDRLELDDVEGRATEPKDLEES